MINVFYKTLVASALETEAFQIEFVFEDQK